MQFSDRFRTGVYAFLSVSLMVSGCNVMHAPSSPPPPAAGVTPPPILAKREEEFDPLKAHLRARRMVDPSDTAAMHKYTKKEPDKSVLGPDVQYVMRNKPTPGERVTEEPWYAGMIPVEEEVGAQVHMEGEALAEEELALEEQQQIRKDVPQQPALPQEKLTLAKAVEPPPSQSASAVTKVRLGEHPGKTRLVLDFTTTPDFTYDLQNDKGLLIINLPQASWEAELKKVYPSHPLILAYIARPAPDGGTVLAVKLRRQVRMVFNAVYKPSGDAGHRIVFDIAAI